MAKKASTKKVADFRQVYNKDWEALPIFQGWLSPAVDSKFRAVCKFCNREFRAHRTDLRMHARSLKHKNAATAFSGNTESNDKVHVVTSRLPKIIAISAVTKVARTKVADSGSSQLDENIKETPQSSPPTVIMTCETDHSLVPQNSEDFTRTLSPTKSVLPRLLEKCRDVDDAQYIISTKVEDTVKGVPVDRLVVYLFALRNNEWTKFGKGITTRDGFCREFVMLDDSENNAIVPGQYKLRYETKMHFTLNLDESIFPFIEVSVEVLDLSDNYQVHLLISPFGYMVFRYS